jgi:antitoxin ParD1/3/4
MAKTTSLILGDHFETYIQQKVESGAYSSASEVIRAALREHEHDDAKEQALVRELDEALVSGRTKPGVWKRLRKKHGIRSVSRTRK